MKLRHTGVILASGALVAACQLIAGIESREVSICNRALLPDASTAVNAGGDLEQIYALNLGLAASPSASFDLDGVCSDGTAATNGCTPACGEGVLDDEQGRDNSAGALLGGPFSTSFRKTEQGKNDRFRLILRLRDYNGQDEDDRVTVELFRSHGIAPLSRETAIPPKNDGSDTWTVTNDSVQAGTAKLNVAGFVTNRRLVARFNILGQADEPFAIPFGDSSFLPYGSAGHIVINVRRGVLSLPLPRPGEVSSDTRGQLAGAWRVEDLFSSLTTLDLTNDGVSLCPESETYRTLVRTVCQSADLGVGNARCNSLSVAFNVETVAAKMGPRGEVASPTSACKTTAITDCTSCN